MTQEEKELLVKDLSARQIYGVKALISSLWNKDKESEECITDSIYCVMRDGYVNTDTIDSDIPIENVKSYLRPLSSMTQEEKIELCTISYAPDEMKTIEEKLHVIKANANNAADFYNKYHFDYRGLIPMGLALEAPEGMYK